MTERICGSHHGVFRKNDMKNEENCCELRTTDLPVVGFAISLEFK
jgi:hypothetical protein